jgi:hypothetical protein
MTIRGTQLRQLPPSKRDAVAGPGLARRNSLELVDLGCGEGDLNGTSVLLEPTDALGSRNRHDVVALSE